MNGHTGTCLLYTSKGGDCAGVGRILREDVIAVIEQRARYDVDALLRAGDDLQIISGAQQGIDIVSRALLNYGDYVFTENPTYPGAIAAFRCV